VHITGAGQCTITASQGGNSNYNAALDVARLFHDQQAVQATLFEALLRVSATFRRCGCDDQHVWRFGTVSVSWRVPRVWPPSIVSGKFHVAYGTGAPLQVSRATKRLR